ncbi:hypothetical protein JYK22_37530, partial [Nonomuraea sp. RK-328]|nr:hypothetical protein [Nonomuraea sp. RK-328]
MKVSRLLITVLAMAAMAWGVGTTGANAATGRLILHTSAGSDIALVNPPQGCRTILFPDLVSVTNRTNAVVAAYPEAGCRGIPAYIPPGTTPVPVGEVHSLSIPF